MEAWEEACSSENEAVLVVPNNKIYHLKPITFSGPCKSDLTMKVSLRMCMHGADNTLYMHDTGQFLIWTINATLF